MREPPALTMQLVRMCCANASQFLADKKWTRNESLRNGGRGTRNIFWLIFKWKQGGTGFLNGNRVLGFIRRKVFQYPRSFGQELGRHLSCMCHCTNFTSVPKKTRTVMKLVLYWRTFLLTGLKIVVCVCMTLCCSN